MKPPQTLMLNRSPTETGILCRLWDKLALKIRLFGAAFSASRMDNRKLLPPSVYKPMQSVKNDTSESHYWIQSLFHPHLIWMTVTSHHCLAPRTKSISIVQALSRALFYSHHCRSSSHILIHRRKIIILDKKLCHSSAVFGSAYAP